MKTFYITFLFLMTAFVACQTQTSKADQVAEQAAAPYQDISVDAFKKQMTADGVVVLDVRTPGEIAAGKIEGAMEIDFRGDDFEAKIDALDKDKTYLIYCKSGGRSSNTCKSMAGKGFKHLYNLEGGYTAWSKSN